MKDRIKKIQNYCYSKGINDDSVATTIAHDIILEDVKDECYDSKAVQFKVFDYFKSKTYKKNSNSSLDACLESEDAEVNYHLFLIDDKATKAIENVVRQYSALDIIKYLLNNADDETKAYVEEFLKQEKATCNSVSKVFNVSNKKVQRKLNKLASYYDEAKFGQIFLYTNN